ncbi:MAG: UvrB/UvrC motif-containing protein [Clostridiales bacterium]|nr:UvrB/UvrC motif-containing protein [Clostridiales bacterium]
MNGVMTRRDLCVSCAGNLQGSLAFENFLKNFLSAAATGTGSHEAAIVCPSCGASYDDFKKTGRLGCAECYRTFKARLSGVLRNIQGADAHEGKIPAKSAAETVPLREAGKLRKQLRQAVADEDYEKAAELRDAIARLAEGGAAK